MRPLSESVVVITGASSGIGRAAAHAFARRGAAVVLASRSGQALDAAAQECADLGGRALPVPTDVTDAAAVERLADQAVSRFGRLDVWVNNAAVTLFGRIDEAPLEAIRQVIETNLFGYIHGARVAVRQFRRQGAGVLVNVASVAGKVGQPYTSAYCTSKFGIVGLSECLRMELMLDSPDVHVCTVLPATIDTPIFQHAANYTGRAAQAMPPVYEPEAVADTIVGCAERPVREVFVGNAGRMMAAEHAVAPGLMERHMSRQVDSQHLSDRPAGPSEGTLFHPPSGTGSIRGGWQEHHGSNLTTLLVAGGVALAGTALLAGWLANRGDGQAAAADRPVTAV